MPNQTGFLATGGTNVPISPDQQRFPAAGSTIFRQLRTYLSTTLVGTQELTIQVMRNLIPVPGWTITYSAVGVTGGYNEVSPLQPNIFFPVFGDTYDIRVFPSGFDGGEIIPLSATIEFGP